MANLGMGFNFNELPEDENSYELHVTLKRDGTPFSSNLILKEPMFICADQQVPVLQNNDLKKKNSQSERINCYSCSTPLVEPYPGIKYCPKCEA